MKIFRFIICISFMLMLNACSDSENSSTNTYSQISTPVVTSMPSNNVVEKNSDSINDFILQHNEYGKINEMKDMTDWADGKRKQVITSTGSYLFYLSSNEVVGVWRYKDNGEREQIFKKELPTQTKNIQKKSIGDIPEYIVLDQFELVDGGKHGDILIKSLSRKTSKALREKVLKQIANKEGFNDIALYSTKEAYEANNSETYLKEHPNVLKNGFLGSMDKDGVFLSGEVLFP